MCEEPDHEALWGAAQDTGRITAALLALKSRSLSASHAASGLVVSMHNSSRAIFDPVCVHAEFMDEIQMALIAGLEKTLRRRIETLQRQLAEAGTALSKEITTS